MQQKQYKRHIRNYFLKKDMQGKYVFSSFIAIYGFCFVFAVLLGLFISDTMTITYEDYNLQVGATPIILLKRFFAANWLLLVIGGLVLIVLTLFFTHRIAGPIYRFEQYTDSMLNGQLGKPIQLRKNDEAMELAEKLKQLSSMLAGDIEQLVVLAGETDKELADCQDPHKCEQLREINKKIQSILEKYSIDGN